METVEEDVSEYSWKEVVLPRLIPVVQDPAPELERETGERRRGRDLLVAVDFGPNSKHAFDWTLAHLARIADTVHLVHAVSSVHNDLLYNKSQELMDDLAIEAFKSLVICREAERLKPAAVILGTRGRSLIQSVLQGSVSEYCFHNCKTAPVIIVPGKEAGEQSVL
ncbi:unnamed protein product [Alopecurus aequalis]